MKIHRRALSASSLALLGCALVALGASAQTARDTTPKTAPIIQDNSFLIEEAYNQDAGVVQHISTFQYDRKSKAYVASFTQEWPITSVKHQFSYGLTYLRTDGTSSAGFGDTRINYRYQLVGDGDARLAIAPRLSAVLATGDYKQSRGSGGLGVEANLPVSFVVSERLVLHGNLGATITPNARVSDGTTATTRNWSTGGSAIWLLDPRFNPMLEMIYQSVESIDSPKTTTRNASFTLSPGVRWAYNFDSDLQIVPGVAIPIVFTPGTNSTGLYVYLSFER